MLLHRNQHFKMFILSRLNIDLLIIPILKVIYTAPDRNSHHIYMALIILLILSEDDIFNKTVHNLVSFIILFILLF
jgi:dymeclin